MIMFNLLVANIKGSVLSAEDKNLNDSYAREATIDLHQLAVLAFWTSAS